MSVSLLLLAGQDDMTWWLFIYTIRRFDVCTLYPAQHCMRKVSTIKAYTWQPGRDLMKHIVLKILGEESRA